MCHFTPSFTASGDVKGLMTLVTVPAATSSVRKSDVRILNRIGCALQESLMHFAHCPGGCCVALVATSVGSDVVSVFGGVVAGPTKPSSNAL